MAKEKEDVIRVSELDSNFKFEVSERSGGERIKACFTCGTCTAGCPVRDVCSDYDPRKIIRMVILGMRKEVLSSPVIWLCSTCYTCYERCPQDVRVTEVMNVLKNMATEEGHVPPNLKIQPGLLSQFGQLYEIDDFDNKKRDKIGLPAIKMEAKDVEEIIKLSGLDKLGGNGGGKEE